MTRGIQLKQLSAADLGHLGIPPDLLGDPGGYLDDEAFADDPLRLGADDGGFDLLALTHEVRVGLEETLALLTAALPADHRPRTNAAARRAD